MQKLVEKYSDIIKEEVNVKELSTIQSDVKVEKVVKPIGSAISGKFGKDVGMIIKYAKGGNVEFLEQGQIKVIGDGKEWILDEGDYQLVYEGLDETNMMADENVIIKLDLELTDELVEEGMIRELSRSLNQMRKEADYPLDTRVVLSIEGEIQDIVKKYAEFLKKEALLEDIVYTKSTDADVSNDIEINGKKVACGLKK